MKTKPEAGQSQRVLRWAVIPGTDGVDHHDARVGLCLAGSLLRSQLPAGLERPTVLLQLKNPPAVEESGVTFERVTPAGLWD